MDPTLPNPRGPLSAGVLGRLCGADDPLAAPATATDPLGEDLQLALYLCYELHYRGFADVSEDLEWDPVLLAHRRVIEELFLGELRARTDAERGDLSGAVAQLRRPPGPNGLGGTLLRAPDRARVRELLIHRSLYHLKEADPQAWVLPRLSGAAKALVAAVEFDEYGGGEAERMHSALYADLMRDYDLDPAYGAYLDAVPAPMLAVVNFMSMAGLHRRLRGALVGQLAVVEITSPLGSQRMVEVVRRTGGSAVGELFYAEHAIADAVHERVMREAIAALVEDDPRTAGDVLFGIRAAVLLEDRLERHLLDCWTRSDTSLRYDLAPAVCAGVGATDTLVPGPAGGPRTE